MKQFRLRKTSIMCFLSYLESERNEKEKTIKRALVGICFKKKAWDRRDEKGLWRGGCKQDNGVYLWELLNEAPYFAQLTPKKAVWERGVWQLDRRCWKTEWVKLRRRISKPLVYVSWKLLCLWPWGSAWLLAGLSCILCTYIETNILNH